MKEKCDNHCETCPTPSQVYCALVFCKATNESIGAIAERVEALEQAARKEPAPLINPFAASETKEDTGGVPAVLKL